MKSNHSKFIFLLLIASLFFSCKKLKNVHFHGKIAYVCDGKGIPGVTILIRRLYDTGSSQIEEVGRATTNNDGYYSLITDVSETGKSEGYDFYYISGPPMLTYLSPFEGNGSYSVSSDQKDVELNSNAHIDSHLSFHLKNVTPFDNNDILETVKYSIDSLYYFPGIFAKLKGINIDTVIDEKIIDDSPQYYIEYTFTKNGIQTTKNESVVATCFGTTQVNISY